MAVSPQAAQGAGNYLAEGHQGGGFLAGAQEQAAVHRSRVLDEVGPGHKGAHRVSQQEVGDTGEAAGQVVMEGLYVPYQIIPPVLIAEKAVFALVQSGTAVTQMVVAGHSKAVIGEETGKGVVPADIF